MLISGAPQLLLVHKNSTWLLRGCSLAVGRCPSKQTLDSHVKCQCAHCPTMKLTSSDGYGPVGDPLCFERKKKMRQTQ